MKISLFNNFGAKNSVPIFQAIAQGLVSQGHTVSYHDLSADVAVIWSMLWTGRMRPNQEVYEAFRRQGKPVIVAEVGMIQRGKTWKIGVNGTGISSYNFDNLVPNRAATLGLGLKPWRSGSNIVIAMQRHDSQQWAGLPGINAWLANVVKEIKQNQFVSITIENEHHKTKEFLWLTEVIENNVSILKSNGLYVKITYTQMELFEPKLNKYVISYVLKSITTE